MLVKVRRLVGVQCSGKTPTNQKELDKWFDRNSREIEVDIPDEVILRGESAANLYCDSIISGESPRFAEMCALRSPPGLKGTDSQNFAGVSSDPFPNMPVQLKNYYAKYFKDRGVDINGKVYKGGLVRKGFGGIRPDPEAMVGSTSDVRDVIRRNNWSSDGMVKEQSIEIDAPSFLDSDYKVSDDILNERTAQEVIDNHGGRIKKKDYTDLREKVRTKLQGVK